MMMELNFKFTGVEKLILHNAQLADPRNPIVIKIKAITSKKKRTEQDDAELSRLEWEGGLYLNEKRQIIVPGKCIEACLQRAAPKIIKSGKDMFKSGVFVQDDSVLEYDGPKDLDELYDDPRFTFRAGVIVNRMRIFRVRPCFPVWSLKTAVNYFPEVVNPDQVKRAAEYAGPLIGLCDYRPRYGRFEVENM